MAKPNVGLGRGEVKLQPHNPVWARAFEDEKSLLIPIFGSSAVAIEHVGSTSVPGLSAKPIIDIEVGLSNLASWIAFRSKLESAGYASMPDRIRIDEVFMPKGPEARRTHYLHIVAYNSSEWIRTLKFRDILRNDERVRSEYQTLKQALAERFSDNRAAYSAAKASFIQRSLSA